MNTENLAFVSRESCFVVCLWMCVPCKMNETKRNRDFVRNRREFAKLIWHWEFSKCATSVFDFCSFHVLRFSCKNMLRVCILLLVSFSKHCHSLSNQFIGFIGWKTPSGIGAVIKWDVLEMTLAVCLTSDNVLFSPVSMRKMVHIRWICVWTGFR